MHIAELAADVGQLSNAPTIDLAAALKPDALAAYLAYEFAQHETRASELAAAFARFLAATDTGIQDDAMTGRATDFAKQHKAELTAIDDTRSRIKAPVLHAQRLIDGTGKQLSDPLKQNVTVIEARIAVYLTAKAETARRAAEEEAQRLAAQAHTAMLATQEDHSQGARDTAIELFDGARQAEAVAMGSTPDLTRTRSLNGAMAGLKDNWGYRVTDITKVPVAYLTVNDAMIKTAIKSAGKKVADLKIPGIELVNSPTAYVR